MNPRSRGDPVEQPGDPLGGLMVGRHARAHQTVRRRQLLEDVDPHALLRQQFVGGVHRRGPGADDRDRQRTAGARGAPSGASITGASFDVGGSLPSRFGIERRVEFDERQLLSVELGVGRDGADRARRDAGAAVHARDGIDVEHLGRREARLVRRRMDAVDRAGVDTGPVAATRLGDHMGHDGSYGDRRPGAGAAARCGSGWACRRSGRSARSAWRPGSSGRCRGTASGRRRTCRAASVATRAT